MTSRRWVVAWTRTRPEACPLDTAATVKEHRGWGGTESACGVPTAGPAEPRVHTTVLATLRDINVFTATRTIFDV